MMTIEEILLGESKNVEFKENLPEKSIKYMKSVVAFANGTGGKIIFGIADKTREVVGFDKEDVFKKMDAIANAGDLKSNAKLGSVAVIRENNGERKIYVHDIRSKEIFQSPCYYLQQNDIVYVEPKHKSREREGRIFQIGGIVLSLASVVASMLWVLKK